VSYTDGKIPSIKLLNLVVIAYIDCEVGWVIESLILMRIEIESCRMVMFFCFICKKNRKSILLEHANQNELLKAEKVKVW